MECAAGAGRRGKGRGGRAAAGAAADSSAKDLVLTREAAVRASAEAAQLHQQVEGLVTELQEARQQLAGLQEQAAAQHRAVGQHQAAKQGEVVLAHSVRHRHQAACRWGKEGQGSGSRQEDRVAALHTSSAMQLVWALHKAITASL